MSRDDFMNIFNETPEDLLGSNWKELIDNFLSDKYQQMFKEDICVLN